MFGSKFSLYECLKFNVHWSSLAMSWIRNSAAAAASRLGLNGSVVGLRGVASFDLSHSNSRGVQMLYGSLQDGLPSSHLCCTNYAITPDN